jgi:L-amino acid N-acyltransferase YncA
MFTRSATQLTDYRTLVNTSQTTEPRAAAQGLDVAWMRNLLRLAPEQQMCRVAAAVRLAACSSDVGDQRALRDLCAFGGAELVDCAVDGG